MLKVLLVSLLLGLARSQLEKEPEYSPLKKDLPYIRCSVCQKMATKAYESVQKLVIEEATERKQTTPKRKGHRFEHDSNTGQLQNKIEAVVDRLCDVESEEGKWMSATDIYKDGSVLRLEYVKPGTCRRECRTMQRACEDVVESVDSEMPTALQAAATAGQSVGMAVQRVCNKLSKVCKKGATPPYKGKRKDEEFWPFTDEDVKMEMAKKMMAGMPGLQQVNNPKKKRKGSADDDFDSLRDEL